MIDLNKRIFLLAEEGIKNNPRYVCAYKMPEGWEEIAPVEFLERVRYCAYALYDCGVRPGHTVALPAENHMNWPIVDLAIMSIGAITVPIYPTSPPEQAEKIILHAECVGFITSSAKIAARFKSVTDSIQFKVCLSFEKKAANPYYGFDDFLLRGERALRRNPDLFEALRSAVRAEDIAKICYTSGTTGEPKGVILTHRNLSHGVQAPVERCFHTAKFDPKTECVLSVLPFTHVFECCALYGYLSTSAPVCIVSEPELIKEAIAEKAPSHFTAVPRLLEKIQKSVEAGVRTAPGFGGKIARVVFACNQKDREPLIMSLLKPLIHFLIYRKIHKGFGGKLRGVTVGGAALAPATAKFFNKIGIPVAQGYGLTETSPGVSMYDIRKFNPVSVGTPLEGVTVEIADDGEVVVSGPNVSPGYYKEKELTAQSFKNGKFYTGDFGKFDEKRNLFILGRKKELLKLSTGKYVAPAPIEDMLTLFPEVEQAMIVGDNRKFCGAFIVPAANFRYGENAEKDAALRKRIGEAIDKVNQKLPVWERIKKFVLLKEAFTIENGELTPTLKKKRPVIRVRRKAFYEEMFGTDDET